jgi:hypothetical protein
VQIEIRRQSWLRLLLPGGAGSRFLDALRRRNFSAMSDAPFDHHTKAASTTHAAPLRDLPVRPPTEAERKLIEKINASWSRNFALYELKSCLQVAIEIELATIPIYLYTYYSINRTPDEFPKTDASRFADEAGAVIMSVAVEEMLHLSLSANILFSLGGQPQLYLHSPSPYPTNLPGHDKLGPDGKPLSLPLAKFSLEQLWRFLEIEYPAASDAPPESGDWKTIGQVYSYVRCIIYSAHIHDDDFKKGARNRQIQPTNYSVNNIDTVFPKTSFNYDCPVPAPIAGAAAKTAVYMNKDDSHAGRVELLTIDSKTTALQAIQTIDAQGEGYGPSKFDDDGKFGQREYSHYYRFLKLQSQLKGYDPHHESLAPLPKPPAPAARQYGPEELAGFVYNVPNNPIAARYPAGRREVAQLCSGLYQYMLIMTESICLQPPEHQKLYFNQALHRSMIWILDKILRTMRQIDLNPITAIVPRVKLAPTFENIDLGPRNHAFGALKAMCRAVDERYGGESWYNSDLKGYVDMIPTLPDVSALWGPPAAEDAQTEQASARGGCDVAKYAGLPKFPVAPPNTLGPGETRHACMGLNECKNQGRTRDNACAGQGYCSTALAYNFAHPAQPSVADHTCHVKNACAGQGGCGLYGTDEELNNPGANACATLGSCATPINAERFTTTGPNQGKSVWLRAREVFAEKKWPELRKNNPALPPAPPEVPPADVFKYGPTVEWIHDYSGAEDMTACGASGMSGTASCA